MAALWATEQPLTPAEIQAAIGGDLAYNTVHTILKRLWDKGLVVRDAQGRRGAYRPAGTAVDRTAGLMRDLMAQGPSRLEVLQRFVSGLDAEEEQALRAMLDERP